MLSSLKLLGLDTIARDPLPPLEWLVEKMIGWGDRVILVGDSGALKSWLLLHMALHLITGEPWLGFKLPQPRRVLYIDEEMPEWEARRRLKRLMAGMGMVDDDPRLANLQILSRVGFTLAEQDLHRIRAEVFTHFNPEVVMVETLARVMIGNENSSGDVALAWRRMGIYFQDVRRTLVMNHHMNKPVVDRNTGEDPRELKFRIRGSTDIPAGGDTIIGVDRVVGGVRLLSIKPRFFKPFEPLSIGLKATEEPEEEDTPLLLVPLKDRHKHDDDKDGDGDAKAGQPFLLPCR